MVHIGDAPIDPTAATLHKHGGILEYASFLSAHLLTIVKNPFMCAYAVAHSVLPVPLFPPQTAGS